MSTPQNEKLIKPKSIEERSFEIITEELNRPIDESIRDILLRVIHTTADFEYADLLEVKNGAESAESFLAGERIYADTSMLLSGVNRNALKKNKSKIVNFVHDPDVVSSSKKNGTTRSEEGIEKAIKKGIQVFAIGNAPTALSKLIDETLEGKILPKLIIATPIGFVGAAESKKKLDKLDQLSIPYIRINGRKGGSAVAAAILNSLFYRTGRTW